MQSQQIHNGKRKSNYSPSFNVKAVLFFIIVKTYECVIYNCNTNITSQGVTDLRTFQIGDTVAFCIHFLPFNIKASFTVKVDTYQAVSLRRNFEMVKIVNTDLTFQISNSNTLSQQVVS